MKEIEVKLKVDNNKAIKDVEKVEDSVKKTAKSTKEVGKGTGVMKKGFQAVGNVLKAGPLVIITAIIGLIKKVSDALMSNAEFANKFKQVMASVNAVIAVAVDSVVDFFKNFKENTQFITEFGNKLKDMWNDPKQAIKDIGKALMDNIINRFKAIGVMGKGIVKLFSKDWKQGLKDIANANIQMWTGVENGIDKVEKKVKESKLVQNLKEASKAAAAVEAEFQRIYRAETALIPVESERNKQIAEQRLIAEDTTKTLEERTSAAIKAANLEKQNLSDRLKIEKDLLENMKAEAEISSSKDEDLRAIAEQEAKIAQISEQSTMKGIELQNKLNALNKEDQMIKEAKAQLNRDAAKEAEDLMLENKEKKDLLNVKDIENEYEKQQKILEIERNANLKRLELEEERRLKEIELMEISEEEKNNLYLETQENFNLQKLEQENEYNNSLVELNKEKNDKIKEDDKKLKEERIKLANDYVNSSVMITDTLSAIFTNQMENELKMAGNNEKLKDSIRRRYAKKQQNIAIAEAAIAMAQSILQAMNTTPFFPMGLAMAATAGIMGGLQISNIKKQKFAKGGMVRGGGTSTSDSISANLSVGESVINAKSTSMFRDQLSEINVAGGGVRFAKGGIVGESGSTSIPLSANDIANQISHIPVIVSEGDISRTQRRVKVVEKDSLL